MKKKELKKKQKIKPRTVKYKIRNKMENQM